MARSSGSLLFLPLLLYIICMSCGVSALQCYQCDQRINNTEHCVTPMLVNCTTVTGVTNTSYQTCVKILTTFNNGQSPWVQTGCNLVSGFNAIGFCTTTILATQQITTCTCNNIDYCNGIGSFEPFSAVVLVLTSLMLVAMQRV